MALWHDDDIFIKSVSEPKANVYQGSGMKLVGIIGTGVAVIAALALTVLTLFGSIPNADWDLREHDLGRRTAAIRPSGATDRFGYDLTACGHAQAGVGPFS